MERLELLARPGGLPVAAGYVQRVAHGYRIYPAAGSGPRWLGPRQPVRFLDGSEAVLVVTELRTRAVRWVAAREA